MTISCKSGILFLFALVFCVCGCSAPRAQEFFVQAQEAGSACGPYVFDVDLTDSLSAYDISFYLRMDCSDREFEAMDNLNAVVCITSSEADTIRCNYIFRKSSFRRTDAYSKFYYGDFRCGFRNKGIEYNKITVAFDTIPSVGTFHGVGLKSLRVN